jgi:carbonic anhydrase
MPTAGLQAIVDKIAPAVLRERKVGVKGDTLVESAIKENVRQSAKDVLKNSELLRDYVQQGKLTLFEAEYQMDTGEVIRLDAAAQ